MVDLVKPWNEKGDSLQAVPAIAATFIGTVVGAGFASGQEIYQFFGIYGVYGFLGIGLAVLMMGWAGTKVFKIACVIRPRSYQELLTYLLGRRLTMVIDLVWFIFFLVLIGVMFAGSGAVFETVGANYWAGAIFTALLLIAVLSCGLPGLISANLIVIPLMFVGALLISLYGVFTKSVAPVGGDFQVKWLAAALQFSAYNLVLAIPVLIALAREYPKLQWLEHGGWLGSIALGVMAGFMQWALLSQSPFLSKSVLPMVELAKRAGRISYWFYAMILWGEMFTTLLANTYGVVQRLVALTGMEPNPMRFCEDRTGKTRPKVQAQKRQRGFCMDWKWSYYIWLVVVTLTGLGIAQFGFINLIAGCYPVFGYLCLIIMFVLLQKRLKPGPEAGSQK
jgi:uncharacterized membrane protein YkvI